MMTKLQLRKIHRWLGLVAGIQLLAWTVSGLYFTVIPIETIRGKDYLVEAQPKLLLSNMVLVSPSQLMAQIGAEADSLTIKEVKLYEVNGKAVYNIGKHRFDAQTGELLQGLTRLEAVAVVEQRTRSAVTDVKLVESVPVDDEYRSGELPAWRMQVADAEDVSFYVGANSGQLRSVRTPAWRWFDFLWSLHVMDYEEREDFNHLLIQAMAILGLITVLSGLILFFATQRWPRRG